MSIHIGKTDSITGSQISIDYGHHEAHDGCTFRAGALINELADAGVLDILIITPNTTKWAHFGTETISDVATEIVLYEAPTTTGNGSAVTIYNKNRNSATAPTLTVFTAPTVTGVGTEIMQKRFGSGKTAGGDAGTTLEWILKQNTKYLFRITNKAGSGGKLNGSWRFIWYEHINIT